jgi:hypothetical protein
LNRAIAGGFIGTIAGLLSVFLAGSAFCFVTGAWLPDRRFPPYSIGAAVIVDILQGLRMGLPLLVGFGLGMIVGALPKRPVKRHTKASAEAGSDSAIEEAP